MKIKLLVFGALFASLCASVQGQAPVNNTPKLHLSFDNVSGTTVINDGFGGSALNGTLNGGASIVTGGKFGNCLQVTGTASSDASVRIANSVVPLNVQGGNAWTVAMWIKTTTQGGTWAYQGDGGWAQNNTTFFMAVNNGTTGNNGPAAGGVRFGQGWEQGTATVDDGNWHHIVFTWDGTTKVQYVDGVVDAWVADQWNNAPAAGNQFWIGGGGTGQGDGQVCLNGLIDEAYVFNKALSPAAVLQLFTNNTVPSVPVSVAVNPVKGYRGQVVNVTATATPAAGTVTNATVDLSAFGLSATTKMVQSSVNVFTNTFTVPTNTNAPIGGASAVVTVIDTEPLVGSGGATFTVVAKPPTNAIIVAQLTNKTVFENTKVTFYFGTTNDAPNDAPFPMTYAWYKNTVLVSTNPMGPYYSFLTTPSDNSAQIYAIAHVADTNFSSISITSAVVTLTVSSGTPQYAGLKQEVFAGATRADIEIGNVGPGLVGVVTNADSAGGFGDNTSRRYSGYFVAPTSDAYVFFVAADDDTDLYLSTDASPLNKRLVAQETGYSGTDNWQTIGGNGSTAGQKRSDQWSPDGGTTVPYSTGIPLVAGQKYYIESVEHNGTGGDNWGITYETETELTADPSQPADASVSRMTAASNNIVFATFTGSTLAWSVQPHAVTVFEGTGTNFTSLAVSDAELSPLYQWYINTGSGYSPISGATGARVTLSLVPANYNGALVEVVASLPLSSLSITSTPVAITVLQAVNEVGFLHLERWNTITSIATLESGNFGTPDFSMAIPAFAASIDNPSGHNNFVRRISGYFIPPTTGDYKFYTTGDDDSDLFLSTDNTPASKRVVCHQAGWNNGTQWAWDLVGGGGATASQMNSSTWSPDGGVTVPFAAGIHLLAGNKYYIEQDWHQGGGGANNAATFALISQADPAGGTPTRLTGSTIAMSAVRCTYVAFTQQPANVTTTPMGYATLTANGTTDGTTPIGSIFGFEEAQANNFLFFQWYTNGVAIPGANTKSITLGPLMPSDNGIQVFCTMRALGYADVALNPIWSNSLTATITISPQAVFEPGLLQEDWWTNGVTSRAVVENGSVGSPNFTYTTPMFEGPSGTGNGNGPTIDYVQRISGFFVPPATDLYTFFTDSDDDSDFFISTDASPIHKRLVAQETGWSGVRNWLSAGGGGSTTGQKRSDQWTPDGGATTPYQSGISLTGGQLYYIEQVHHNGAAGGTHATATFKGSSDSDPVNGVQTRFVTNTIGMYVPRIQWVAFLQQPNNATVVSGGNSATFTVAGTSDPSPIKIGTTDNPLTFINNAGSNQLQYQWYKNSTLIPGANRNTYTQTPVLPSDNGSLFSVQIRALGYADNSLNRIFSNSVAAVLTVVTDTVPPTISYAATFVNTNQVPNQFIVNVTFNEWMDSATLGNALNYSIAGSTITGASVASDHRTVQLLLTAPPTLPVSVVVTGVKDLSGNTIVPSSTTSIQPEKLTFTDVGTPGTDPAYPSIVSVTGNGNYIISAQGHDIWDTADGFNFAWEMKTNDFDVAVRGVSITKTDNSAKMGLMVRQDLTPGSANWDVVNNPASADGIPAVDGSGLGANNIECNTRQGVNLTTASWKSAGASVPTYPNAWVRLTRTGSVLKALSSSNHVDWVTLATYDTATNVNGALPAAVFVGLCTTAHANDSIVAPLPPPFLYYNTAEYADYSSSFSQAAKLSASKSGGNLSISWTPAGGHLESSPALVGPGVNWQPIGSANPATVPIGVGPQFFRVVNP